MKLTKIWMISSLLALLQLSIALASNPRPFVMRKTFSNGDAAKTDRGLCTSGGKIILPAKCQFLVSKRPGQWWVGTSVSDDEYEGNTGQLINDQGEPLTSAMFSDYVDGLFGPDVIWGAYGAIFVTGNDNGRHLNYVVFPDGMVHCLGRFNHQKRNLRFVASERPNGSATLFDLRHRSICKGIHFEDLEVINDEIAVAGIDGKFGVVSTGGDVLLDIAYDKIEVFDDTGVACVFKGAAEGLYDIGCGWLIQPEIGLKLDGRSVSTTMRSGSMIGVVRDGRYGVFDLKRKKMIVPTEYDSITYLTSSESVLLLNGKLRLLSLQTGKEIITGCRGIEKVSELSGITNCTGAIWRITSGATSPKGLLLCFNGHFVKLESVDHASFHYLDKDLIVVLLQNFEKDSAGVCSLDGTRDIVPVQKGIQVSKWRNRILISKVNKDGKTLLSIVDHGGNTLLDFDKKATFLDWQIDVGGHSKIVCDGKAGLVDGDCNFVLPCQYEDVGHFGEGLVPARQGGKWGFVELSGQWAIPARFEEARSFKDGYAPVRANGKWGFIDKSGKAATPFAYEDVKDVREGHFRAQVKGKWGIFALDGTCTLPAEYDAILAEGEPGYGGM